MCSSCGQKYRGLSGNKAHRNLTRYRRVRGGKREVVPPPEVKQPVSEVEVPAESKKGNI